jgi:hypothetical protein
MLIIRQAIGEKECLRQTICVDHIGAEAFGSDVLSNNHFDDYGRKNSSGSRLVLFAPKQCLRDMIFPKNLDSYKM